MEKDYVAIAQKYQLSMEEGKSKMKSIVLPPEESVYIEKDKEFSLYREESLLASHGYYAMDVKLKEQMECNQKEKWEELVIPEDDFSDIGISFYGELASAYKQILSNIEKDIAEIRENSLIMNEDIKEDVPLTTKLKLKSRKNQITYLDEIASKIEKYEKVNQEIHDLQLGYKNQIYKKSRMIAIISCLVIYLFIYIIPVPLFIKYLTTVVFSAFLIFPWVGILVAICIVVAMAFI